MLQQFIQFFKERNILQQRFLVAVSGGLDSTVLAELCFQANLEFSIAHCNFQLRDEESTRDEQFVKALAKKYGREVYSIRFDTQKWAEEQHMGIQEAARILRYTYFNEILKEQHFDYTLLAHHAQDAEETLLMNFFRGTGLEGLTGIPLQTKMVKGLRPLLLFTRTDLEAFAKSNELTWVTDSSNASVKYTRNYMRHVLIPAIKEVYPALEQSLQANMKRFKSVLPIYQDAIDHAKKKLLVYKGNDIYIPLEKLRSYLNTSIPYEIIRDFGFSERQVDELCKLMDAATGKFIESEEWRIIRFQKWFIIASKNNFTHTTVISEKDHTVHFDAGVLTFLKKEGAVIPDNKATVALLDTKNIEYPLTLRRWKTGDYFYPLGMKHKKKLSRFLTDMKLPLHKKEQVWVLTSGDKIIWVVGLRIDNRFKITPSTTSCLEIRFTSRVAADNILPGK